MELLLPLLCLCVLSCSGSTSAAGAEPKRIDVKEWSDVTLPCSFPGDITYQRFEWKKDGQEWVYAYDGGPLTVQHEKFKGRVSVPGELKTGNASITIKNTKMTDIGNYTCEFPQLNQKGFIYLRVVGPLKDRSGENIRGTASKPSLSAHNISTNQALLRCEVHGDTFEPVVQLKDSNKEDILAEKQLISESEGHYNITLQTTVNKTDTYYCVATQKEISHQISDHTEVHVPGPETPPETRVPWWIWMIIAVLVFIIFVLAFRLLCRRG